VLPNPVAAGELQDARFLQPARRAEVHVLDARTAVAEPCQLQQSGETPVVPDGLFAFEQEREAFVKRQRAEIGLAALLVERGGHAGQLERVKDREGLFDQHTGSGVSVSDTSGVS